MPVADPDTFADRLYRVALLSFPRPLRLEYGDEMRAAFSAAHAQRQRLGRSAGRRFALLAWLDTVRAGLGSRFGRGGVSAPPPEGLPGLVARATDRFRLEIGTDLRLAARSLLSTPTFTVAAILVLALGVGVNGALFSALRAALLEPAPFPAPEQLVVLELLEAPDDGSEPPRAIPWSYPKYRIVAERADLAAAPIAAYAVRVLALTGVGDPLRVGVEIVTPDYTHVLGVTPMIGSDFDRSSSERHILLSWQLWRDRFGEDPTIVGREIVLGGESATVIGVMPPGFGGLSGNGQIWISTDSVPVFLSPSLLDNADGHWLQAIGRLRPDSTIDELRAHMTVAGNAIEESHPWEAPDSHQVGGATPLEEERRNPRAQQAVSIVSGAAGLVLLLACINLAILVLARGRERQREIAVRLALGGSRGRVGRSIVVENLLLAAAAGLVGLVVANAALHGLAAGWPDSFRDGGWNMRFVDSESFRLDLMTIGVTFGLALTAGLLFAVGPALRLTRADLGAAMRSGAGATAARQTGRSVLVAAEVAVAIVLAVGAGLMISSLDRLVTFDDGIDAGGLLTFSYSLPRTSPHAEESSAFHDAFLERLRALAPVRSATLDCSGLRAGHCWITRVQRAGDRTFEEGSEPGIGVHMVDESHFETIGAPVVSGRALEATDRAGSTPVVVINEHAARTLFEGEDPVGRRLFGGTEVLSTDGPGAEIVGVVGDVLYDTPAQGVMSEAYLVHRQEELRAVTVTLRVAGDPFAVVPSVRAELAALDPDLPVYGIATIDQVVADQFGDTAAVMTLLSVFAGLAILLAATGVWGVVAHAVTGRRRELGIRLALGAVPRQVVAATLRQGVAAALTGAVMGMIGAWAASRLLASMLYDVSPTDAMTYLAAGLLLVLVSVLAAWFPARRAARVDPVRMLRAE